MNSANVHAPTPSSAERSSTSEPAASSRPGKISPHNDIPPKLAGCRQECSWASISAMRLARSCNKRLGAMTVAPLFGAISAAQLGPVTADLHVHEYIRGALSNEIGWVWGSG